MLDPLPARRIDAAAWALVASGSAVLVGGLASVTAPGDLRVFLFASVAGLAVGGYAGRPRRHGDDDGTVYLVALASFLIGIPLAFGGAWICAALLIAPAATLPLAAHLFIPAALERAMAESPTLEDRPRWWRAMGLWLAASALPGIAAPGAARIASVASIALGLVVSALAHRRLRELRDVFVRARRGESGLALVPRAAMEAGELPALVRARGPLDAIVVRRSAEPLYRGDHVPLAFAPLELRSAPTPWRYPTKSVLRYCSGVGAFVAALASHVAGVALAEWASPLGRGCGAHVGSAILVELLVSALLGAVGIVAMARLDRERATAHVVGWVTWLAAWLLTIVVLSIASNLACWD